MGFAGNSHRPELIPALEVSFCVFVSTLPTRCHLFRPRLDAGEALGEAKEKTWQAPKKDLKLPPDGVVFLLLGLGSPGRPQIVHDHEC